MLIFEERGKPENPEKNFLEQRKEPTTNLNHYNVDFQQNQAVRNDVRDLLIFFQ